MIIYVYRSVCKVPAILVRFKRKLNYLNSFPKNTPKSNFMKIRSVGAALSVRTDRHVEANSR